MVAASAMRRFGTIKPSGRGVVIRSFDPAAVGGRTIFPSRVFDPDEVQRVLKSGHQSRKIGAFATKGARRGWPIYTLTLEERATCPRTCSQWTGCYGNNMQAAERIVHGPEMEAMLRSEVAALSAKHPGGFIIRLHVLGDFYSREYVRLWFDLLDRHPALHVFGFTAHQPDSDIGLTVTVTAETFGWSRFAIRFSGAPDDLRAARVVEQGQHDANAITCPAQTGGTDCCGTCGLCWQSERSIAFGKH